MAQAIYKLKKDLPGVPTGTEFYYYSCHDIEMGEGNAFGLLKYASNEGVLCLVAERNVENGEWSSPLPAFSGEVRKDEEWFELTSNLLKIELEAQVKSHEEKIKQLNAEISKLK